MIATFTGSIFRTDYTYLVQVFSTFIRNLSTSSSEFLAPLISDHCEGDIKNRRPISQRQEALGRGWIFNFPSEDTLDIASKFTFVSS